MSDSQDSGFEELEYTEINLEESIAINYSSQNKAQNKTSNTQKLKKRQKIFTVQIQESQKIIDMNILQNQFYLLKLYEKDKLLKQNVQRRYSDFDLLFQILQKKYPGFVFPAFPEKGILSYVKTKVTVTKDEEFLKNRIKIIQRFFNAILNEEKFNPHKNLQIKKFFSKDEQYEIFKKTNRQCKFSAILEINKNKSIVDSTWGVIKDFFKMNQVSKYTSMIEDIKKEKQPFQDLLSKTQQIFTLINDQFQANQLLVQFQLGNQNKCKKFVPSFTALRQKAQSYNKLLQHMKRKLTQLEFRLDCENEDYLMILKKIEFIQQLKQSQQNYKNLSAIESEFLNKRTEIQDEKKEIISTLKEEFRKIVEQLNQIQREQQSV